MRDGSIGSGVNGRLTRVNPQFTVGFMQETPIERVFRIIGGQSALAARLGISREAVRKYKRRVPAERVLEIEAAVEGQVSRNELRPDLYPI